MPIPAETKLTAVSPAPPSPRRSAPPMVAFRRAMSAEQVLAGARVVIVRPCADHRDALCARLEALGARVSLARTIAEALREVSLRRIDAVLAEPTLPDGSAAALALVLTQLAQPPAVYGLPRSAGLQDAIVERVAYLVRRRRVVA